MGTMSTVLLKKGLHEALGKLVLVHMVPFKYIYIVDDVEFVLYCARGSLLVHQLYKRPVLPNLLV